jgi:hypothetical protein
MEPLPPTSGRLGIVLDIPNVDFLDAEPSSIGNALGRRDVDALIGGLRAGLLAGGRVLCVRELPLLVGRDEGLPSAGDEPIPPFPNAFCCLERASSAVILVPEIALKPGLFGLFWPLLAAATTERSQSTSSSSSAFSSAADWCWATKFRCVGESLLSRPTLKPCDDSAPPVRLKASVADVNIEHWLRLWIDRTWCFVCV